MAKRLTTLLKKTPPWFSSPGDQFDISMGTMGRMVRNLPGHPFPGWSTSESRDAASKSLLPAVLSLPGFKTCYHAEMPELSYLERRALMERKQITACLAARQDGCHLLINDDQNCLAMINEEEHLVMHAFAHGLNLPGTMKRLANLATALERKISFASNIKDGVLTSMPAECGEGLQLYTILHLPGFALSHAIPQLTKALEKLRLCFSPFYPELGEDSGNIFIVFTLALPQGAACDIAAHLANITGSIIQQELNLRRNLRYSSHSQDFFLDQCFRAYALLRYAQRLEYPEFLNALSMMRMAVAEDIFEPRGCTKEELQRALVALYLSGAPCQIACRGSIKEEENMLIPLVRSSLSKKLLSQAHLKSNATSDRTI